LKDQNPSSDSVPETVLAVTREAFEAYLKNLPSISPSTTPETFSSEAKSAFGELLERQPADESEAKKKVHIKTLESAAQALQKPGSINEFYNHTTDVLLPYLGEIHKVGFSSGLLSDAVQRKAMKLTTYQAKLDSNDHQVLLKFTKHFENRFLEDMKTLNVFPPDQLTRVTDYGENPCRLSTSNQCPD
jgi:cysteinyl-tRNA synthetase